MRRLFFVAPTSVALVSVLWLCNSAQSHSTSSSGKLKTTEKKILPRHTTMDPQQQQQQHQHAPLTVDTAHRHDSPAAMMIPEQQQEAQQFTDMMRMQQGTIMDCSYCRDVYPELRGAASPAAEGENKNKKDEGEEVQRKSSQDAADDDASSPSSRQSKSRCPVCGGSGPQFRPARMMDRRTSAMDVLDNLFFLAEQDRRVREMDVGVDVKSVSEAQREEFQQYKRRLLALLEKTQLYHVSLEEALTERIHELDAQFDAKPEDEF